MRSTSEFLTIVQLLTALQASPLLSPESKLGVAGVAVAEFNGRINDKLYEDAATAMLAALVPPAPTPAPEEAAPAPAKRAAGSKAKAAP